MAIFVDRVVLHAAGGDGGDGCASIHREKFKPLAGPDGGNGGNGGSVILEVDWQVTTLLDLQHSPHRRAQRGTQGQGDHHDGATAPDLVVGVPDGTVVKTRDGDVLADLVGYGTRFVVAAGGRGGLGNEALASARYGTPTSMVGRVGTDSFGNQFMAALTNENIEASHVGRDEFAGTGVGLPIVDTTGANSIIVVPQANLQCTPDHVDKAADVIGAAAVVLAQLELPYETVARALEVARAAGARTILNPAPMGPTSLQQFRGLVDLIIPNESEAAAIAPGDIRREIERGVDRPEEQPTAMVAADEVGVLALPSEPRGFGQRFLHHRRRIHEHLELAAGRFGDHPPCECLQCPFDEVVIIAPLRIDRDPAAIARPRQRERITTGRIAHAERDDAPDIGPQIRGRRAMMRALFHPDHLAMAAFGEPLPQAFARSRRGICPRHAECGETQS